MYSSLLEFAYQHERILQILGDRLRGVAHCTEKEARNYEQKVWDNFPLQEHIKRLARLAKQDP